jgi:Family of unknown function (DUF6184)
MKTTSTVMSASWVAVLLFACGGQNAQSNPNAAVPGTEPPSGVTAAQNTADQQTIERLADVRCAHEQKCNNVGKGQKYASLDVCKQQLASDTSNDLNATSCPRGLDQDALNRCMSAVDKEPCSVSLDTLTRLVDCRTGALCMK